MSDCPNVEIRELLPEYLGGTLSAVVRSKVEGHVATCAECADELALLRLVREAYAASAPAAVDVKAIVRALRRPVARPVVRSWRRSHAMQIAAAISFIAVGGMSLAVARSFINGAPERTGVETTVAANTTLVNVDVPVISFAGGLGDIEDEDLEALLSALDNIEALPVTETADPLGGNGRQGS